MFDKRTSVSAENLTNIDNLGNNNVIANGKVALAVGGNVIYQPNVYCQIGNDHTVILNKVLETQIDYVKDFLNQGKPSEALTKIEEIEKTFKEVFDGALADKNAKRRLLLNKGSALMLLGQTIEAAKCYLDGYECDSQNELANALRIKAYFLKNDIVGIKKAIAEIPPAHKTSVLIAGYILEAIQTDVQNFSKMPDMINELCFEDHTNCIIASKFYSLRNDEKTASEYFYKAKIIAPDDWQVLAVEGTELLGNEPYKLSLNQVIRAKELLEKSWNVIREQHSVPITNVVYIPINLSSAYRVLGMQKEEKELVDYLYIHFPEEQDVLLKKILVTEDKKERAILAKKLDVTTSVHYAIIAAMVYMDIQDYEKAVKILSRFSEDNTDLFTVDLLSISCYKELGTMDFVDDIIQKQKSQAVKSLFSYIKTDNIEYLSKSYKLLRKQDNINIRIEIGTRLYQNRCYSEAVILYSDIRKKLNASNLFLKEVLDCLWRLKRLPDLKSELEKVPKEYVDIVVKQYWTAYYDTVGDYHHAISIAEEIFNEEKNNANYATNLLGLYHKNNQQNKIISILQVLPGDLNEMTGDFSNKWQLMLLMQECNYPLEELVAQAYSLFCQNMDNEKAWSSYFAWTMTNLSPENIKNDKTGFVLYDKASGAVQRFIIDENLKINTNKFFKVLRGNEPEATILLQASPKEIIKLGPRGVDLEVYSINSKYILLKDIIQTYLFIEFPNCAIIRFDGTTPEEIIEKIKPLFEMRQKNFNLLKDYYHQQVLPISTIASMLGSDSITIMHELCKEKLIVASGTRQELTQAAHVTTKVKGYIVDALTIFNIFNFNLQDWFEENLNGKIYVSQKTKDVIQNKRHSLQKSIKHQTGFIFSPDGTGNKVALATFEDLHLVYTSEINMLIGILDWMDKHAIIVSPSAKSDLTEEQKKLLSCFQGVDPETAVVIETALENKLTILSDDYILRVIAKTQFDIDGVWFQCLLMYTPGIELSKYVPFIVNSMKQNHSFISFNARVLLGVLLTDKTEELQDFKIVAKHLYECTSDSAFKVIYDFHKEMLVFERKMPEVNTILIDSFLGGGGHNDFVNRLNILKFIARQDKMFEHSLKEWAIGHFISL